MSGQTESASRRTAPRWGVWVFGLVIALAVWSMLMTFAAALILFPIYDLTPALVLGAALLTRRWNGVPRRWFGVASVLAAIMVLQWVPWYVWLFGQHFPDGDVLSVLTWIYAVELLVLVILVIVISVLSIRGIRNAVPLDVPSIES